MDTMPPSVALETEPSETTDRSISQRLAHFASHVALEDVPGRVVSQARLHVLDCLGIGLASASYDFGVRTVTALRALGGEGRHGVLGMPVRLPLRDAIHANGTLIHGLDYDDTHGPAVVHASAAALATALGVAVQHGRSGADLLLGYLIGVEMAARIGTAAKGGFHQTGFHPTGVVNAFGATLAAARLAELTERQMADAQGIVLSMAAGSLEFLNDGAWTKRQHPGWAGVAGVTASALAASGFKGPGLPYEGRFGLYALYMKADAPRDLSQATADLGSAWELERVALKPYPACHFNHAFADATLALMRDHGLTPERVARVTARIGAGQVQVVCEPEAAKQHPTSAYEAQFSVPYMIAATLVRGRFTLDELDADALSDRRILDLCTRVGYEIDPDSAYPRYYSGEVIVETTDGKRLSHRESVNRGSDANPLTEADVVAKFQANAARTMPPARAQRILDAVMKIETLPSAAALADLLTLSPAGS